MNKNNEEKSFGDGFFFQVLVFGSAAIIWFFIKNTFSITDDEHFGFIGSIAIVFVTALLIAAIMGIIIGLLEPHKEKIQKVMLIAIIVFAAYIIGSIILNKSHNDSDYSTKLISNKSLESNS